MCGSVPCGYGRGMSSVERVVKTTPQRVWDVLADGWLYPLWVVGATRMREVDDEWPAVGSRIKLSIGMWPALLNDETEILACDPPKLLGLRAKPWPFGQVDVTLELSAYGAGTRVLMTEDVVSGPGKLMPAPVRKPAIVWRNNECLRRLAFIAERR